MAALIQAVKQGSIRGIQLVIQNSHDSEAKFQKEAGTSVLIEACKFGDQRTGVKMAKILLDNGAEISNRDCMGLNALHWACSKARKEMIDLFFKRSEMLDFNAIDLNGNSVLYHAVNSGDCDFVNHICRLYTRNGGGIDTKNNQGISAVDLALKLGHKSCAAVVNRATGLTRKLNRKGYKELNYCMLNRLNRSVSDDRSWTRGDGSRDNGNSCEAQRRQDSIEKLLKPNHLESSRHLRKSKFISLSSGDLTLKERAKLPTLSTGHLSLVSMYGRLRSQTDPPVKQEKKSDIIPRKSEIFKREIFPSMEEDRLPNTYKDLLVDFNSIYSVENTSSYRKGFSKPKDKTKIVTFSDSDHAKDEGVKNADDKTAKNKLSRKVSRMNETKFNATFISKGKERRKSRKSRDEA